VVLSPSHRSQHGRGSGTGFQTLQLTLHGLNRILQTSGPSVGVVCRYSVSISMALSGGDTSLSTGPPTDGVLQHGVSLSTMFQDSN
jgi:hypothetical protein